ncbi:hypothetical protein G4B88_022134 [Cannabis sativa]|uniref:Uncharacterized protein n=1 Tax=Cannabis sativa TaxID=3483 RepID=A0A7J6FGA6_CANSA|nr:hypothetical protein G4B88_022134 [Cannabis sativa]
MLCFKCGFFDHEQVDCGLEEVKTRHSSGAMVPYYGNWLKEDSKVKHCFEFLMAHSIKKRQWKVEGNNKSPKEPTELQSARAEKVGEIRSCCKGNRSLGEDTRKEELTLTIGEDSVVHGNKKNFVEVVPSHQKRYQVKENQRLSEEASGPWLIGGDFNECNGQKENFMLQNLDRCLANVEWVNLFPNRKAFYLE